MAQAMRLNLQLLPGQLLASSMAHKSLKGRKAPRNKGIRDVMRNERHQKRIRAEARKTANKKKKEQEEAENMRKRQREEVTAAAEVAETAEVAGAVPERESLTQATATPKRTKKENKIVAIKERNHKALYAGDSRILLVGEGNFSFASALCRHLGTGANVIATAFDSETKLNHKYPDAANHRKAVDDELGGTTLVGVDATRVHHVREFKEAFRTIIWNFPYAGGGEADVAKGIEMHVKLLSDFFKSALQCLDPEQESTIHVALKSGEPYKSWKIVQVAKAACPDQLELLNVVPFAPSAWPGYEHRRTKGFNERFSKKDSEELEKGAKVYIFGLVKGGGQSDQSCDSE